jgi:hypothetical protein
LRKESEKATVEAEAKRLVEEVEAQKRENERVTVEEEAKRKEDEQLKVRRKRIK